MMILRSVPTSPFARKVLICAALLGLADRIATRSADTNDAQDSLRTENPLGKLPALLIESGAVLYDSRVIVEYLDALAGGGLIPRDPERRFAVLTQAALADGIMDAALLQVYETRFRDPARHEPKWLSHQTGKIDRALDAFVRRPPEGATRTVADVGLACALGYLDLRFEGRWRQSHEPLVGWLDAFAADVPAFAATRAKPS